MTSGSDNLTQVHSADITKIVMLISENTLYICMPSRTSAYITSAYIKFNFNICVHTSSEKQ